MIPKMRNLPSDLCAECWAKIKAVGKAEKERRAEKSRPRREAKRAKRLERNEGTAAIRGELLDLTGGVCERCGFMPVPEQGHMHHTEPGGGRVQRQHIGNVAWLCSACHGVVHAHPVENKGLRAAIAAKREARR